MKFKKKESLPILFIIISLVITIYVQKLGDNIVLHWDFVGNIKSLGPSETLFLLPMVMCLVYCILLYYEEHPEKINSTKRPPVGIEPNHAWRKYCYLFRATTMLLLLYITVCSARFLILHITLVYALLLILIYLLFTALHILHKK
ncbi:DUF1648 domain-containing protein [Segatella cerevisiae]|uniref:DUF1648 domain-containing protein n=1 Tax=Segatella cerevisiae TaxID=2053716 RepID=UPI00374D2CD5